MSWIGYFTYDGTEIINVDRMEKYIGNQRATWGLKALLGNGSLPAILQEAYDTPLTDPAPWVDPDRMDSYDFWGAYPVNVAGIEDSTRESAVVEYIRDGGSVGALRHGTRSVVFSVALMGASEGAVEYGMNWLKAALLGANCSPRQGCSGAELVYFASEPVVDPDAPDIPPNVDPVFAVLDGGRADSTDTAQVLDTFDRSNNPTSLGETSTGQTWTPEGAGVFGIEGDAAVVTTGVSLDWYSTVVETGTADVIIETLIGDKATGDMGLKLRSAGPDAGFAVFHNAMWDTAFPATQVGPSFSETFVDGDRMRASAFGDLIEVWRQAGGSGDWVNVMTTSTSTYNTNTRHGLAGWSTVVESDARWQEFRILYTEPGYVIVDGGAADTVFTDEFDGGDASTEFPIELFEPYPEPFVANPPDPQTDPTGCLTSMLRRLKEVKINDGPEVTAKRYLSDGSVIWLVSFTATAGDPFEYGRDRVVVERFLGADTIDPFGPGIDGTFDSVGYPHTDAGCPPKVFEAIYDPLCPALVAPPAPVDIPAGCFEPENDWWRRFVSLPEDLVPQWGSSVPVIGVTAQYEDLRQVRLRLYADVTGAADPEADECSPVGDLMVTYVPQGMTLVIDGVRQAVYVVDLDGVQRRADSLVFSSDGKPIIWPELTCGYGYLLTVDTVDPAVFPEVDLNLISKAS